jgi:hypothetical protein
MPTVDIAPLIMPSSAKVIAHRSNSITFGAFN